VNLREWAVNFLRPPEKPAPTVEEIARSAAIGSVAWAEPSQLLVDKKYNPDDLIGRKGFEVYKRMMLDEQVKAVVHFKRASVTGRQWFFDLDFEKHGLSEKEARKRVDIFTDMLEMGYRGAFVDGLNAIMKAQWQGFSITEQMFGQFESGGKTYWGLQELKPKPFDTFYPVVDDRGQVHRWVQQGGPGFHEQPIDLRKFVYYRYNPDMDEHYGWSELRSAYRSYLAKDITISLMNVYVERLAGGFPVAKPSEGTYLVRDSKEWKDLQQIMKNLTSKSSVILPSGIDLEIVQVSGSQVTVFEKAIEIHDLAIAKALLMPNLLGLSHTGQTGAYSQSETQFDVFMIIADDEANRLADAMNEQVFAPLGKVNFADGVAPRFRFKPLSQRKRMQMLKTWVELVTSGAVLPSDTDEHHVRDLMDFPEKGEVLLNPLNPATPGGKDDTQPRKPVGQGDNPERPGDDIPETIRGNPVSASAFARAQERVSFAVIDRQAQLKIDDFIPRVETAIAEAVVEGLTRIEEQKLGSDPSTSDKVGRFELNGFKVRVLNTQVQRALQAGVNIGEDHAKREIDKAKGERFKKLDFDRLGELAQQFLNQRAFTISGDLKAGVEKAIQGVLMNAIKFTWTDREIKRAIYKTLVQQGILSGQTAMEALGLDDLASLSTELDLQGGLAPYRLDTVIRTNMFEAVNEARFNVFTDPELDGFVRALEYSAILDSRTTEICRHMDGRVYASNDPVWNRLRPPNHMNCRSLLIPVTEVDEDVEITEEKPSVEPQAGFG
jgi:SPP1 gp7 family putative phage head morphogenesis protein